VIAIVRVQKVIHINLFIFNLSLSGIVEGQGPRPRRTSPNPSRSSH
jgi:hypothetical protein